MHEPRVFVLSEDKGCEQERHLTRATSDPLGFHPDFGEDSLVTRHIYWVTYLLPQISEPVVI